MEFACTELVGHNTESGQYTCTCRLLVDVLQTYSTCDVCSSCFQYFTTLYLTTVDFDYQIRVCPCRLHLAIDRVNKSNNHKCTHIAIANIKMHLTSSGRCDKNGNTFEGKICLHLRFTCTYDICGYFNICRCYCFYICGGFLHLWDLASWTCPCTL